MLCVWVSSGSSPEVCGHFVLVHVYHRCKYETFQDQTHGEVFSLYVCVSGHYISQCFAGKHYRPAVLDECSTETIFSGIGLQDKGLCTVIVG